MIVKQLMIMVVVCVLLFPAIVQPSEDVEAAPNCTDGWCEDTFEAGGRVHEIRYPEKMSVDALAAQEAVTLSFPVLQSLFGVGTDAPFSVELTLSPTAPTNWAQTSQITDVVAEVKDNAIVALEVEKCHIEMFVIQEPDVWLPTIAHEMGHCFQYHYIDSFRYKPPDDNWWADGSAEWMALLIYPEAAAEYLSVGGNQNLFATTYFSPLFQKQYEAVYFWAFLETYLGQAGIVNILTNLPEADSVNDYHDYLKTALPDADDAMQTFAISLFNDQIPHQPPFSTFNQPEIALSNFPHVEQASAAPFGIDYRTFTEISVPDDKALRITVSGMEAAEIRATLLAGSVLYWLQDDTPADLCDPPPSFTIATSRTGTIDGNVNAVIGMTLVDVDDATCLPENEPLPDCMVGTWQVTDLPEQATPPGVTILWEPSNYYLTLHEDGTFEGAQLDMLSVADAEGIHSETSINVMFSGILSVEPIAGTTGEYEVTDMDYTLDSASYILSIGGETMDITDMILGFGEAGAVPAFRYFNCIGSTGLQYTVEAEGMEMQFMTQKAP